jgi:hypothetical protein
LGGDDSALYIHESCFPKKDKSSVGVARQYCGRTGKIDNCQMGVLAALGQGKRVGISDFNALPAQAAVRETDVPLLSVRDVTGLLEHYLPKKNRNEEEVLETIRSRQRRRQKDIGRRLRTSNPPEI